jgi:Protein of unknown function (DUF2637)
VTDDPRSTLAHGAARCRTILDVPAPPDPNRDIRRTVYAVTALLAMFAFTVSYAHIYDLGLAHAQHGIAAKGTPLSVDLLIVAATLVLYMQKREPARPSGLARFLPRLMLWAGIAATIAANVAYGWPSGWLAAACSAWPGAVFAGVVEMVLVTARALPREGINQTLSLPAQPPVPSSAYAAAEAAYAASVAGGNPLAETALAARFRIPRSQARKIRAPQDAPAAARLSPERAAAGAHPSGDGRR